jgi:hypothetical protein
VIAQGMPEPAQYRITSAVPKRIMELLKAIQIEHHNTQWSVPSLDIEEFASQSLLQMAAVV